MDKNDLRMFIFLSELLDRRVVDEAGNVLGKLNDLLVQMGELFPKVILLPGRSL